MPDEVPEMKETTTRLRTTVCEQYRPLSIAAGSDAHDFKDQEEKSSRQGTHRTARVRPRRSKCDPSGLSRYLETRHQFCNLGRPKNVPVPKRDRKKA